MRDRDICIRYYLNPEDESVFNGVSDEIQSDIRSRKEENLFPFNRYYEYKLLVQGQVIGGCRDHDKIRLNLQARQASLELHQSEVTLIINSCIPKNYNPVTRGISFIKYIVSRLGIRGIIVGIVLLLGGFGTGFYINNQRQIPNGKITAQIPNGKITEDEKTNHEILQTLVSLCARDFGDVDINCGDKELFSDTELFSDKEFDKESLIDRKLLKRSQIPDEQINKLDENFKKDPQPLTLITLNNAKILQTLRSEPSSRINVYVIGSAIPLKQAAPGANEAGKHILSGIAKKQDEFNSKNLEHKLFVILADDKNDGETAKNIAEELAKLAKTSHLLAVIGPYSSSNLAYILPTYTKNKLPLISPTVSAAMQDIEESKSLQGFFDKQNGKSPFFFRMVEDTAASIKITLEYLKNNNYKNLIVFYDDQDLYSLSLFNRLNNQIKDNKKPDNQMFSIVENIPIRKNEYLAQITKNLTKKYGGQQNTTAILYFQGAFKDEKDNKSSKKSLFKVLDENKGEFLVVGNNTMGDPTQDLVSSVNQEEEAKSQILGNIVAPRPWFPLEKSREFRQHRNFWKSEDIINSIYVMAYDATEVLLYAISHRENTNESPKPLDIQKFLNSDLVQSKDCSKLGISENNAEILTTNITFNGSDRCPNPNSVDGYVLVKPVQIKPNTWKWQPVNKNSRQ